MRTLLAGCAGALFGAITCTAALAVDLPKRKPGLWEMTMHMSRADIPPQLMKFCIDAETDEALYKAGMNAGQGMCSRKDLQRSGDTMTTDSECTMGGTKMTTHAVTTFTGDTAYSTTVQTHFDPPMMGRSESSTSQEAKWVSPCPADMQPGDMIGPNGMKMNLKSLGK